MSGAQALATPAPQPLEDPNPFRGPQPYRFGDQHRFIGRDEAVRKLLHRIRAHPCVTLYGPSGAGKSSLMQAGVLPRLVTSHGFRPVRVDGWPAGERPLQRLVGYLFAELGLGAIPADLPLPESLKLGVELARPRSEQPILIYLDQLEQLFLPGRDLEWTGELIQGVGRSPAGPCEVSNSCWRCERTTWGASGTAYADTASCWPRASAWAR